MSISFNTIYSIVNKVTNDCFVDDVYSPAFYELSLRTALLSAYAPDFDMSDCDNNDKLWEKVTSQEAENILFGIYNMDSYNVIKTAIDKSISHRLAMIESSPMSLSDIALSKMFGVITEKIEGIDTEVLSKETVDALIESSKQSGKENFERNLIDAMVEKGIISKHDKTARRSGSKRKQTSIVKLDNAE